MGQKLMRRPAVVDSPTENLYTGWDLFHPETGMPVAPWDYPAARAEQEGCIESMVYLWAPSDGPERLLMFDAWAAFDSDGDSISVTVHVREAAGLQHVGVETTSLLLLCPCETWQLEALSNTPPAWVQEAIEEHMHECVVLSASRMTALAATSHLEDGIPSASV